MDAELCSLASPPRLWMGKLAPGRGSGVTLYNMTPEHALPWFPHCKVGNDSYLRGGFDDSDEHCPV